MLGEIVVENENRMYHRLLHKEKKIEKSVLITEEKVSMGNNAYSQN